MTPEELRLECLKLVQQAANVSGILIPSREIISRARAYADFVIGLPGHSSADTVKSVQKAEFVLEEEFRSHGPVASQFEPGATDAAV